MSQEMFVPGAPLGEISVCGYEGKFSLWLVYSCAEYYNEISITVPVIFAPIC